MATLSVPVTTDFSAQNLINIDVIQFGDAAGNTVATFSSQQFGPGEIETDVLVSGGSSSSGSSNSIISINVAAGDTFSAADWTFANWGTFDQITIFGTSASENITGSSQNDTIGNLSGLMGIDILNGGDGDDVFRLTSESGGTIAGAQFHGGNGIDEMVLNAATADYNFAETTISGMERLFFIQTNIIARFDNDQVGAGRINALDSIPAVSRTMIISGGSVDLSSFVFIGTGTGTLITLNGVGSNDVIIGSSITDTINGADGSDTITGGLGADRLFGDGGNDVLRFAGASDISSGEIIDGGAGTADTILIDANVEVRLLLATISGIEVLHFGAALAEANLVNTQIGVAGGIQSVIGSTGQDTLSVSIKSLLADVDLSGVTFQNFNDAQNDRVVITGSIRANSITGSSVSDQINGGAGNDTLAGGLGNDIYTVDAGDTLIELAGGGQDEVRSSASFVLGAGVAVEVLGFVNSGGTGALNLTGNTLAQRLIGNAGDNRLDGGGGNGDTLEGGDGADTYIVRAANTEIVETGLAQTDTVRAVNSFALGADDRIEVLRVNSTLGLELTGNSFGQTIIGGAGNDRLDSGGGSEVDRLIGGAGNDTYVLRHSGDVVVEAAGGGTLDSVLTTTSFVLAADDDIELLRALTLSATTAQDLTGNALAQSILGNAGANRIDGKGGDDVLTGNAGADAFVFTTAAGAGNIDRIVDFEAGVDVIELENAVFAGIAAGAVLAERFAANATGQAQDASDRIIHDTTTGALFFDADGNGAGARVRFATVEVGLVLTEGDFLVI